MKKLTVIIMALAMTAVFLPGAEAGDSATIGLSVTFAATDTIPVGSTLESVDTMAQAIAIGGRGLSVPTSCIISWYDGTAINMVSLDELAQKLAQALNSGAVVQVYNSPIQIVQVGSEWEISSAQIGFRSVLVPVISIELEPMTWALDGVKLGEQKNNRDAGGSVIHKIINTGNIMVNVDIGYGPQADSVVHPGLQQAKDTFVTKLDMGDMSAIIPPDGRVSLGNVAPGDIFLSLPLIYGAPTALSPGLQGHGVTYEIRAYSAE